MGSHVSGIEFDLLHILHILALGLGFNVLSNATGLQLRFNK